MAATAAAAGLAALPYGGTAAIAAAVLMVLTVTGAVCWAIADPGRGMRLAAVIRAARGGPPGSDRAADGSGTALSSTSRRMFI